MGTIVADGTRCSYEDPHGICIRGECVVSAREHALLDSVFSVMSETAGNGAVSLREEIRNQVARDCFLVKACGAWKTWVRSWKSIFLVAKDYAHRNSAQG